MKIKRLLVVQRMTAAFCCRVRGSMKKRLGKSMLGSRIIWINRATFDRGVIGGTCTPVILVTARVVVAGLDIGSVSIDVGVGGFGMSRVSVASGVKTAGGADVAGIC